jgi:XisI protein
MDKLIKYRSILKDVLNAYASDEINKKHNPDDMQMRLIMDTENDHYQALYAGWRKDQQIFSVIFHFDIIDSKIWVQRNISDYDIIEDLELKGIPKSDIVLAFHSPQMRPFTEYAVA